MQSLFYLKENQQLILSLLQCHSSFLEPCFPHPGFFGFYRLTPHSLHTAEAPPGQTRRHLSFPILLGISHHSPSAHLCDSAASGLCSPHKPCFPACLEGSRLVSPWLPARHAHHSEPSSTLPVKTFRRRRLAKPPEGTQTLAQKPQQTLRQGTGTRISQWITTSD